MRQRTVDVGNRMIPLNVRQLLGSFMVVKGIGRPDLRQVRELVGCRGLHMASALTLRQCLDTVPGRVSLLDLARKLVYRVFMLPER